MSNIEDELQAVQSAEAKLQLEIQDDLLGIGPSILGRKLRPVKLSTLALLQRTGNELVSGKPTHACSNLVIDACKLVVLQSVPLQESIRLSQHPEELETLAFEVADTIDPSEMDAFQNAILSMLNNAQNGRVEPIPQAGAREELTVDSVGEP